MSPASDEGLPARSGRSAKALGKSHQSLTPKGKGLNAVLAADNAEMISQPVEVVPPWQTLPYMVIVAILKFASSPLSDDGMVRWLVGTGRTCRAFAEPALTVLYQTPHLPTAGKFYGLAAILAQSPSSTMFKYRPKVECVTIDVGMTAVRPVDLANVVRHCPRLSELDIRHFKDMSPYRQLDDNLRFTYPAELFANLAADDGSQVIRLKSWRWSQRMMGKDLTLGALKGLHLTPAFHGLRKLTFVNYQRPLLIAKDPDDPDVVAEDKRHAENFAGLLQVLPDLIHLVMESSTVVNDHLLPLLPRTLQHLELINCWDVNSDHFSEYLVTHGQMLRELTLHHNQSLSIRFLPVLASACPNLAALRMNLTYYNHHEFYHDSDPFYEHLLTADEVPTWPSSLQVVELENLRQWDRQAAEVFFKSLVDSAAHLPKLRHLAIKAMLDIPWRQRSEMRDKWVRQLKRVFKRPWSNPTPARSLRVQAAQPAPKSTPSKKVRGRGSSNTASRRRSGRIASLVSASSSRASSVARGSRRPGDGGFSYREPDSDEDSDTEAGRGKSEAEVHAIDAPSPASSTSSDEGFVQGLCEVVDIRFDNQKPVETQFSMGDFLDSDHANSDDEWTGEDDGMEASDYAW